MTSQCGLLPFFAGLGWLAFTLSVTGLFFYRGAAAGFLICVISACCVYALALSVASLIMNTSYSCLMINYKLSLAKVPQIGVPVVSSGGRANDSNRIRQDAYRVGWASDRG